MNGKLLCADKNLFELEGSEESSRRKMFAGGGSFTLPLEEGDNEVAVAIANNFYGWGLMLCLADPEGVHLAAK